MGWRELEKNAAKELCKVVGDKKLRPCNIVRWSVDYRSQARPGELGAYLPDMKLYVVYKYFKKI